MMSDNSKEKPLLSVPLVLFLIVVCAVTAVTTYMMRKPPPKVDPHAGNKNVARLKQPWKPYRPTKSTLYIEKRVFPHIKKNQKPIKDCYFGYRGKGKRPAKGGVISVEFFVKASGDIEKAKIFRSEIKIPGIETCILNKIKSWKLPSHRQPKSVRLQYPFFFR